MKKSIKYFLRNINLKIPLQICRKTDVLIFLPMIKFKKVKFHIFVFFLHYSLHKKN